MPDRSQKSPSSHSGVDITTALCGEEIFAAPMADKKTDAFLAQTVVWSCIDKIDARIQNGVEKLLGMSVCAIRIQ